MRNVSKSVVPGVLVLALSMLLAVPAQAKPRDGGRWFERTVDPVVRIIKKLMVKTLGDGLIDPRP